MSENSEVDTLVRSSFTVKDSFHRGEEGATEYSVIYEGQKSRLAFRSLCLRLTRLGFTPRLSGSPEDATLIVTKSVEVPKTTARTPVFLALLCAVSIVVAGWGVGIVYSQSAGGSPILIGATFALGVTLVIAARGVAQRIVARRNGLSSLQYYLPNIPLFVPLPVLYYLPTFGSITFLRAAAVDRDSLFDFYFIGALVGVIAALSVALAGASSAVVFAPAVTGSLSSNPSVLQTLALAAGGNGLSAVAPSGETALLSPIEVAAWVGFLISFLSLVPAALFDGGRMSTLVLGTRGSRITTLVTAFLLVAIDVPNYWVFFLLIFLLAAIQPSNETLDSISKISRSRKITFLVAMALVFLCVPIPHSFLTFPL